MEFPWSGTFHAVGARLLREYANRIGLNSSFTILDWSDAADLMDVVRHDLNLSAMEARFSRKETCLAIYSFAINSGASIKQVLEQNFAWAIDWKKDLRKLFGATAASSFSKPRMSRMLSAFSDGPRTRLIGSRGSGS
jgi:DNA helicase II / ATP-dependent DNA helicase PcrA